MTHQSRTGRWLYATSLLALMSAPALADNGHIETVVVTAEKRTVDLQKAPVSATVLSGDDLAKRGIRSVDQLMFTTPSLTVNNFGQGNDFNIRGIGKGENNIQTPSGVVTYRDGVPILGGFVQEEPYYDIADIEVFRGPQGTFAGTNATGGAVYIKERNPDLSSSGTGYIQGQFGNYTDVAAQGAVNFDLTDDLAIRIAADGERHDSFWTITPGVGFSGNPGRDQAISARVSLLWQPTEAFQAIWKVDANYFDNGGYPADPVGSTNDPFHVSNNAANMAIDKSIRSVLDLSYKFGGDITLRSLTGYQQARASEFIDLDGTNLANLTFNDIGKIRIWSEEVNLVSPTGEGPWSWIVGGFFEREVDELPNPATKGFDIGVPKGVVDVLLTYRTPKQHEAVFGQVTYNFTSALTLQVGARFNASTFDLVDHQETDLFGTPLPGTVFNVPCTGGDPDCGAVTRTGHEADSKATGKVALNWQANENNFLYVFGATGHKDGGQNTTSNEPANIKPEDVRNIEAGWKWSSEDGHLHSQVDGYWNDYHQFQVTLFDPSTNTSPILNAPEAKISGAEAQIQGNWDHVSLDLGASWLHSRFGAFHAINGGGTPGLTCDVSTGGTDPACQDLTGEELVYAPNWTVNGGFEYRFDLGNDDSLAPRIDYAFVGPQWAQVFHSPALRLGSRSLFNAQINYSFDTTWLLTAYSTNLANLHYIAAESTSLRYAAPPRQYGIRIAKTF